MSYGGTAPHMEARSFEEDEERGIKAVECSTCGPLGIAWGIKDAETVLATHIAWHQAGGISRSITGGFT